MPSATSGLTASESCKSGGNFNAASSKTASNDVGPNTPVKAQPRSASKDPGNVPDHLRTGKCLVSELQQDGVQKIDQDVEKCRLNAIRESEASNSTRPQVRQHAANELAERGGIKQAHKSKVGQRLTI